MTLKPSAIVSRLLQTFKWWFIALGVEPEHTEKAARPLVTCIQQQAQPFLLCFPYPIFQFWEYLHVLILTCLNFRSAWSLCLEHLLPPLSSILGPVPSLFSWSAQLKIYHFSRFSQRSDIGFHWFSSIVFLSSISFISALIFMSFLELTLGLICSFSGFLRWILDHWFQIFLPF